ncbi:hypothetical protein ABID26_000076 [Mesorhizobium shonense]|uniref:Uncharacterized protein n=1 Tax=Mesorhizobium shonense TaxID=1209948 RepID=A0ABV2HJG7_9HYPH
MAAKRPEGVGPTGLDMLLPIEVGAPREATPSVAFGDISPSRGEIGGTIAKNLLLTVGLAKPRPS